MSYMFYCYGASKTGNPLTVWGEILQIILVKNAPDIFRIKSVMSELLASPHLCLYSMYNCYFSSLLAVRFPLIGTIHTYFVGSESGLNYNFRIYLRIAHLFWAAMVAGKCRTNPWPEVPDLPWCRNAYAGLWQFTNGKNADAGLTFLPALQHSGIFLCVFDIL